QDAQLDGGRPSASQLVSGELAELEMVLDETLRKYPPAWVGPRRSVEAFEFEGRTVPARAFVNYCSWASHHLPDVFPDPEAFRPERFTPEARAALPKGARSEEHTSELQSRSDLVCRLLLEKKKKKNCTKTTHMIYHI